MARTASTVAKSNASGKSKASFTESELTKGQARKLTALRKSIGEEIAHKAFADWLTTKPEAVEEVDKNTELIAEILVDQINQGKLRIPRGGYLVRRGRGRVVVERAAD